jgi:ATP-dependent helicase HepA
LSSKFFFETGPEESITLIPEDVLLHPLQVPEGFTLLVVDEAHRAAARGFDADERHRRLYQQLLRLAGTIPRLLLLSGTPVLHQEDGFLAMLHLLDPAGFPLEERAAFLRRVRERQAIAESIADLEDDASALFVEDALEKLQPFGIDDPHLESLIDAARQVADVAESNPERAVVLRTLRIHLMETYRLHRRLLRTRRDDRRVRDLLPQRSGATILTYDDPARAEAADFLNTWRSAALDAGAIGASSVFETFVERALSHPKVLLRTMHQRIHALECFTDMRADERGGNGREALFGDELSLLRHRAHLIEVACRDDARAQRLIAWLASVPPATKAIVFVDDAAVADALLVQLQDVLGSAAVVRENGTGTGAHTFERTAVRVLVCDAAAEEGLNLQRLRAHLVHFDLPLEPARIEQRMGRVDRLEARSGMKTLVVVSSTCAYEQAWFACLEKAIRVFDRTVAPLQYVLIEKTQRLRKLLLDDGVEVFDRAAADLTSPTEGLDAELKRIRAQEALDAVDAHPEQHQAFFEQLQAADERMSDEGEGAIRAWVEQRLRFRVHKTPEETMRLVYDSRSPTLIPLLETLQRFSASIDDQAGGRRSRTELPMKPFALDRVTAQATGVPLLRIGHPFLDSMEAYVRSDDRGIAFAMWRHVPSLPSSRVYFRFDFFIEADTGPAVRELGPDVEQAALRRRGDEVFPVEYRTIWLNADMKFVRNDKVLLLLERPYDKVHDVHLRSDRWPGPEILPELNSWDELCFRARREAERFLREAPEFQTRCAAHATACRSQGERVATASDSRLSRLHGAAYAAEANLRDAEVALLTALEKGILRPSVRVDSAGAVVLSPVRLERS